MVGFFASLLVAIVGGALTPGAAAGQETHLLVVAGLGGDEAYTRQFLDWGLTLRTAAVERYGLPPGRAVLLAEDPDMDDAVSAPSRAENVRAALEGIAERAGPDDRVLVVLIGHGSARGEQVNFNLPGPDLEAEEIGALLDALPTRKVALVNAASASGPFVQVLAAPGRTVITATKTHRERNETQFGGFFAEAFAGDAADLDKNGAVSLLEAFTYARREVERFYEEESLLVTEHAVLDDDGDGEGSEEPGLESSDGALAASFTLGLPGARAASASPGRADSVPADSVLARLYRERADLEQRVADLRARRSAIEPAEYDRRLEDLLVELALKSREIRDREGGG